MNRASIVLLGSFLVSESDFTQPGITKGLVYKNKEDQVKVAFSKLDQTEIADK